MLRLWVESEAWVVRRVEHMTFLDDRTVRRRVSVDYLSPRDAVTFVGPDGKELVRVLPLTIMRKKSLINFDLRQEDGRPLPLLGLREAQALTLATVSAWASIALSEKNAGPLSKVTRKILKDAVTGDQGEMITAYEVIAEAREGQLATLRDDNVFKGVLDRFANSFLLYSIDDGPSGARRIVKFSYDEPLELRYRPPGYKPMTADGASCVGGTDSGRPDGDPQGPTYEPTYEESHDTLPWWKPEPLKASLGFTPTLIRVPVPAAELAASFHFEITAPPEVSIVAARLLAGRPATRSSCDERKPDPPPPRMASAQASPMARPRDRPSFDMISGGYPTVDLHVAEVPFGSLSRAQVALQANTKGWLATAVMACWLATATLIASYFARNPASDVASTVLLSFTAGMVALLARPDPHQMVSRLLSGVRYLAALSASLSLAGALVFAFVRGDGVHTPLAVLATLSLLPTVVVTLSWVLAQRRLREKPEQSPWEQHRPQDATKRLKLRERGDVQLAEELDQAPLAYDLAVKKLDFHRPAVRVASSERVRATFPWDDHAFADIFHARLKDDGE
jgi:hypothetical protein